jgi:hypothetical protein
VFFNIKEELLSLAVPFIKAGLEDNEYCIWITGEPITDIQAFQALEAVVPDAHHYLGRKQLEILSSAQWYLPSGKFEMEIVLENWMYRAQRAKEAGFDGIRITGNPVWLQTEEDWTQFGRFEEIVHHRIKDEKIVALCTYPVSICHGSNVLGTLSTHTSALLSDDKQWRRLELSSR